MNSDGCCTVTDPRTFTVYMKNDMSTESSRGTHRLHTTTPRASGKEGGPQQIEGRSSTRSARLLATQRSNKKTNVNKWLKFKGYVGTRCCSTCLVATASQRDYKTRVRWLAAAAQRPSTYPSPRGSTVHRGISRQQIQTGFPC